jgi:pyruvate dehydrogenase E1 component
MNLMRNDLDPVETSEWRDAFDSVLEFDGADRAGFLLEELIDEARRKGAPVPYSANTPYVNTIAPYQQPAHPGDGELEHRIRSLIRWNAVAIVLRANKESSELGGHIASFQSAATLYDTGFNHFWHARPTVMAATCCSCRATARRASTRARSWRAG